jgi:hypothetical protein
MIAVEVALFSNATREALDDPAGSFGSSGLFRPIDDDAR